MMVRFKNVPLLPDETDEVSGDDEELVCDELHGVDFFWSKSPDGVLTWDDL